MNACLQTSTRKFTHFHCRFPQTSIVASKFVVHDGGSWVGRLSLSPPRGMNDTSFPVAMRSRILSNAACSQSSRGLACNLGLVQQRARSGASQRDGARIAQRWRRIWETVGRQRGRSFAKVGPLCFGLFLLMSVFLLSRNSSHTAELEQRASKQSHVQAQSLPDRLLFFFLYCITHCDTKHARHTDSITRYKLQQRRRMSTTTAATTRTATILHLRQVDK